MSKGSYHRSFDFFKVGQLLYHKALSNSSNNNETKNKTKTEKKIERNVFFYLPIKYPKRGYKIQKKKKKEERKKKKRKQEKKTIFCLCPPGDAVKLNLDNSNTKVTSPISNYLVTSGATILFVFRLRLFLHLIFLDPSMTKAQFFNMYFLFFVSYQCF